MNANQKIDAFLDAIVSLHKDMDFSSFWPMNPPQLQASYSDLLALQFYQKYRENQDYFGKAMANLGPNLIRSLLYQVGVLGLKVANYRKTAKISQIELVKYVVFLLDIVASKMNSDEFGRDGFYQVLNENQVRGVCNLLKWKTVENLEESRKIANLGISLEALVWSLQFDTFRTAGTLIHGPYFQKEGTLVIKDFIKLKSLVWGNNMFTNKLSLYLLYRPGFSLKFNYGGQQVSYSDSPVDALIKYAIKIDGADDELDPKMEKVVEKIRARQVKLVESFSPIEIIKKGAEIYFFMYKEFFDYYQVNWRPLKEIYQRIETKGQHYLDMYRDEGKIEPDFYRKQFDPRNNYVG